MRPDIADRLDQHLWELQFKVHTRQLTCREIVQEIDFARALYQALKAGQMTSLSHSTKPTKPRMKLCGTS